MWRARLAMEELFSGEPTSRDRVLAQLEQAHALARSIHDERLELQALVFMTSILRLDDDLQRARSLAESGIAEAGTEHRWQLAELMLTAALLAHWTGDDDRATTLAAQAGALADELGNEHLSIQARLTLSFTTPATTRAGTGPVIADLLPRAEELGDRRLLGWLYPAAGSEAFNAGGWATPPAGCWPAWSLPETRATGSRGRSA